MSLVLSHLIYSEGGSERKELTEGNKYERLFTKSLYLTVFLSVFAKSVCQEFSSKDNDQKLIKMNFTLETSH